MFPVVSKINTQRQKSRCETFSSTVRRSGNQDEVPTSLRTMWRHLQNPERGIWRVACRQRCPCRNDEVDSKNFRKDWQNSLVTEFLETKTNSKNISVSKKLPTNQLSCAKTGKHITTRQGKNTIPGQDISQESSIVGPAIGKGLLSRIRM